MKKLQKILEEIMEISRTPMLLYNTAAACIAATAQEDSASTDTVRTFICSDADSLTSGPFHYFKVTCSGTLSYVLLVSALLPDAFTIGRLTVCQLQHLLEAKEDSITKTSFIYNVIHGNLTPAEMERQKKKLRLSSASAIWIAFVIESEEKFENSFAYQMISHAFAGYKSDFCCELDDKRLLLIKDTANMTDETKIFAQTLVDTLRAEALVQTHIGYSTKTDDYAQFPRIYQEACTALRIRHTFFTEHDTAAYDKLGIGRLISELPADLCKAFLFEIFGTQIPDHNIDEETQNTIQKFYENNLNISETARQLYLHRNTLVYRLERLEKILGLDIRKFDDAMTFKLAMMVLSHLRAIEKQQL